MGTIEKNQRPTKAHCQGAVGPLGHRCPVLVNKYSGSGLCKNHRNEARNNNKHQRRLERAAAQTISNTPIRSSRIGPNLARP